MERSDYITYKIKRHGKIREIMEPKPELKAMQKKILRWLCERGIGASKYAHGFVKGRSILTAVKPHINKNVVLAVDIHDFFGSIDSRMLRFALEQEKISSDIIGQIINNCAVYNYGKEMLPQGAPTSPFLANVVAKKMDYMLAKFIKNWMVKNSESWRGKKNRNFSVIYTRYADDLLFSSAFRKINHMLPGIEYVLYRCGFCLNPNKTRYLRKSNRQLALGLIINKKMNVPREYWRNLRAELHQLEIEAFKGKEIEPDKLIKLAGKIAFIKSVNKSRGQEFALKLENIRRINELSGRHFGLVRDG